ncbi:MAG: ribonuclease J [Alphaproteobacteria bacterium]|nr:ribonuclease J [Alphaproteobacteria bacterium]
MTDFKKEGIYFMPLGGADDIGMNMYMYAVDGKIIVVDAGYGFLMDNFPGMELAYASPEFLEQYKDDIVGLFITHGHEDHMGAIAQIWPTLQCPVYGMDFSLGLIRERLDEFKMADQVPLVSVNNNRMVEVENFSVEFIDIAHTVPQTCVLAIRTKYGNILHATDWRFDDEALAMIPTNFKALKRFADEGVSMLVCDSTNVLVDKKSPSESDVRENLIRLIPQLEGGVIVTCFASNLMRLESLLLAAKAANRTPVIVGRTLVTNMKIATECGYLADAPKAFTIEQAKDIAAENALYICTGSQANYHSAMSFIANGESKYIKLDKSDTIIFSSKVIPGNEDKIERMQEKLMEQGATVITDETELVHTSGHACRGDLKKMYDLLKPAIVLPVHGEKSFIREHKRFALACGIKEVFSARNGDMCLLKNNHIERIEQVFADIIGWDRSRPVSLGAQVIRNRKRIAFNCSMYISAVIKGAELLDLQMTSIDILEEDDWLKLSEKILAEVRPLIEKKLEVEARHPVLEDYIRGQIRRRVFAATDIKPVTLLNVCYLEEENENC